MLERFNMRTFGVAFVAVVLFCTGIYLYVEWNNKRFMSELGEPPQPTASSEPAAQTEDGKTLTMFVETVLYKILQSDPTTEKNHILSQKEKLS